MSETPAAPAIAAPGRNGRAARLLKSHKAGMLVLLVLVYFLLYLFAWRGMRFFLVPSRSMEPTLLREDYLVTLREPEYKRGDIVVIWDAHTAEYLVKRIAGLPGDRVAVRFGALFLNGDYASEPYIAEPMQYRIETPVLVPEDQVFLLGDNRNDSDDSHTHRECDPIKNIVGKVRFIYYPYDRWGPVPSYPLQTAH